MAPVIMLITTTTPTAAESSAINGFTYLANKQLLGFFCVDATPLGQQVFPSTTISVFGSQVILPHATLSTGLAATRAGELAVSKTAVKPAAVNSKRALCFSDCIIFANYTVYYASEQYLTEEL